MPASPIARVKLRNRKIGVSQNGEMTNKEDGSWPLINVNSDCE